MSGDINPAYAGKDLSSTIRRCKHSVFIPPNDGVAYYCRICFSAEQVATEISKRTVGLEQMAQAPSDTPSHNFQES